jgi:hypothetical protein
MFGCGVTIWYSLQKTPSGVRIRGVSLKGQVDAEFRRSKLSVGLLHRYSDDADY